MNEQNRPNTQKRHEDKLPSGYEWVPISQWRLGQLESYFHVPSQRAQAHIRPINSGSPFCDQQPHRTHSVNCVSCNPSPRLGVSVASVYLGVAGQHEATIEHLENLQEQFRIVFLSLPTSTQAALRLSLAGANLELWRSCAEPGETDRSTLKRSTQSGDSETPGHFITPELIGRMERLKQRLKLLAITQYQTEAEPMADDHVHDDDTHALCWGSDCLKLASLIESALITISFSAKNRVGHAWAGPVAPLTAPPGGIKIQQRSLSYRALSDQKSRERYRKRAKEAHLAEQAKLRVSLGAQPTTDKESAHFNQEHPYRNTAQEHDEQDGAHIAAIEPKNEKPIA